MVKISSISLAILAGLASLASADNCKQGLMYCGQALLRKGNYYNQIVAALKEAGKSTDDAHVNKSLFYCEGGSNGDISYQAYCFNQCVDGGDGGNDFCDPFGA